MPLDSSYNVKYPDRVHFSFSFSKLSNLCNYNEERSMKYSTVFTLMQDHWNANFICHLLCLNLVLFAFY